MCAVAVVLVATSACTGEDDDAGPTADATVPERTTTELRPTEPPTTTTTPRSPEQEVEAGLLAATRAYYEAARRADPQHKVLEQTSAGPSLDRARTLLAGFRRQGVEVTYVNGEPPMPEIRRVTLFGPSVAFVEFCLVDNALQVRATDGAVVNDEIASGLSEAELRLVDGTWKLFSQRSVSDWPDGKGCDR